MTIFNIALPSRQEIQVVMRDIVKGRGGILLYISFAGVLLGVYAVLSILLLGHGQVTNTSSLVPWGIQISTYVYLVLVSTGCTFINFFGYKFYRKEYAPFGTRMLFLGLVTGIVGMGALATELGRFDRMIYFILSPQPRSPMWWMAVWYTLLLALKFVEFVNHKRNKHSDFILWATFIVGLVTYSTLGSIFGVVEQRAYYYSSLLPIYFLMIGFLCGSALATIVSSAHYYRSDEEYEKHVQPFRKSLRIGLGLAILTTFWRLVAGLYAQGEGYEIFRLTFMYSLWFGLIISLVLPFIVSFFIKCQKCMIGISLFVLITQFKTRVDFVVGGFQVPVFKAYTTPDIVTYTPSPVEIFVVIASISLIMFLYILADKIGLFPEENSHE